MKISGNLMVNKTQPAISSVTSVALNLNPKDRYARYPGRSGPCSATEIIPGVIPNAEPDSSLLPSIPNDLFTECYITQKLNSILTKFVLSM